MKELDDLEKELNDLAKQVITAYSRLNLTVGVLESMTGGLISHIFTNQEGSSRVFGGSLVVYSARAKHLVLDIPMDYITQEGTVSEKMIEAMLKASEEKYPVDIHLATTGIAGKSIEGLPRGLVFIGTNYSGNIKIEKLMFKGTRLEIKCQAVRESFRMLIRAIQPLEKGI